MIDTTGPAADCERVIDGFLRQPVNTVSSLAFVAAGLWVLVAARRRGPVGSISGAVGMGLIATGLGSGAFHGPGGPIATWAHDTSLLWLLLTVLLAEVSLGRGSPRPPAGWIAAAIAVAGGIALIPGASTAAALLAAGAAVLAALMPLRRRTIPPRLPRRLGLPLGLLGVGAVTFLLSRTGGPWCDPDSAFQGHAVWHLLTATGLGIYGVRAAIPNSDITQRTPHGLAGGGAG